MAAHKQHDFHLVNPSIWPFVAALSAFALLFGAVMMFAGWKILFNGDLLALGAVVLVYTCYAWWADVVAESDAGDHTPVVQIGLRYGMILFIMSEVMFFAAWFWMYFKHAIFPMQSEAYPDGGVWPPVGVEVLDPWHLPLLNTLILLTSGATCTWAHHAIIENDRKSAVLALWLTVILGVIFTLIQIYEYTVIEFPFAGNIYGSSFFMATGFHGLHVIIGTIFLVVNLAFAMRGMLTPERHISFESAAWYWHFVDVVWLFLFAGIYVGSVWGL